MSRLFSMDDRITERIEQGIETHRKGDVALHVVDGAGKPVPGAQVQARQVSHAFQFGANSFMLGGYPTERQNERWSEAYTHLFNQAIVAFYWSDYETAPGKLRFDAGSEPRFRRPPVDAVLDWCAAKNLAPKGHNLMYHSMYPEWLPEDAEQHWPFIERRFEQIAQRYGERIGVWDVVNETLDQRLAVRMPRGYLQRCYELAKRFFPAQARLFVNERSWRSWGDFHSDTSAYYLMIDGLLQRGLRVDGIGLQYHLFKLLHELDDALPTFLNPAHVLAVLDQYADYRRPIHISEITIPAGSEGDDGEQIQAELARGLYRLWFSHPAVEAIVWWNLADGKLWGDEGRFKGGLLREDLTAKPTYEALDEVINHEWKTQVQVTTGADGIARFRGFGGKYELRAEGCPPQQAHIRPGFGNEVTIHLA